ncbi:MAG TPA: NifU N-terminal domain-containing protein [Acidimicrobiia bacterium]|nr:NifU N-terminal domain-containing protein [Acidimicrobiia bacterium]
MAVIVAPSPNPNAMKFTVGKPVGGPTTHIAGTPPEQSFARDLLAIPGVTSIFMTADFVTISKTSDVTWESIIPEATSILEGEFGG